MKKSDIAIYISAILTLILTTFVVFSTQKVTYESKINDMIDKDNNLTTTSTNSVSLTQSSDKTDLTKDNSSDFKTKIQDIKQSDATNKTDNKSDLIIKSDSKKIASKKSDTSQKKSFADSSNFDFTTKTLAQKNSVKKIVSKKKTTVTYKKNYSAPGTYTAKKKITNKSVYNTLTTKSNGSRIHTVRAGDTLWKIAKRYGTSTIRVIRSNKLSNPNMIYPGMKIRIPA